jgi:hypothetical protein
MRRALAAAAAGGARAAAPALATSAASPPSALLRLSDLPAGWTADPSNPAATPVCGVRVTDGAAERAQAGFQSSRAQQGLRTTVARFAGRGAATAAINRLAVALRRCTTYTLTIDGDRVRYRVTTLAVPRLGDQSIAIRLSASSGGTTAVANGVLVRRGRALTGVNHFAIGRAPALSQTVLLARRAVARLDASRVGG